MLISLIAPVFQCASLDLTVFLAVQPSVETATKIMPIIMLITAIITNYPAMLALIFHHFDQLQSGSGCTSVMTFGQPALGPQHWQKVYPLS